MARSSIEAEYKALVNAAAEVKWLHGFLYELGTPVPSKDQLADIFTKPLSSSRFALLRTNLNGLPVQLSLRGHVKDQSLSQVIF
uniref:Uncharacterized protein n=1 Tax=Quercus lobata TaxID=97700 RepID=A0A7N2LEF8_QUELO